MDKYFYVVTVMPPPAIPAEEEGFLERLITTACRLMDINRSLLYEPCRRPRITHCRWIVWEIMIAVRGYSLKEAGRIFRNYDHTTVIHGMDQLALDIHQDELLRAMYKELMTQMDIRPETIYQFRNKRELNKMDRRNRIPQIAA